PELKPNNGDFPPAPVPKASAAYATASFPAGGDAKQVEADIRAILAKVVKDGVPPDLVEAAKQQERRANEFQKNGIEDLASIWSDAIALYGLKSPDEDYGRIAKVTVEDVNRVAREY